MTALVILGMIGAEFNSESKNITPQITKKSSKRKVESMPPGKYGVGRSLWYVLMFTSIELTNSSYPRSLW